MRNNESDRLPFSHPSTSTLATEASAFLKNVLRIDPLELGSIPIYEMVLNELGFDQAVQLACDDDGDVPAHIALRLLLHSRLAGERQRPLSRISEWLSNTVLPTWYRTDPAKVNEYRLGRLLDKVSGWRDVVWTCLVAKAHQVYELDLSGIVGDATTVTFAGAYHGSELITHGKERDVKQLLLTLNVTSKFGIPVVFDIYPGNTTDCSTVPDNISKIEELARCVDLEKSEIITWGDRGRLELRHHSGVP